MKVFCRPTAISAAVLVLAMVCSILTGQTKLDMRSQVRNIDFSAASSTSPFPVGTVLPSICTIGQTFYKANAAPGQNLYFCTATNIWTVGSGSGDSLPTQSSNAGRLLGSNGTSASWRRLRGFTDDGAQLVADGTVMAELGGNNTWTGHQYFPASTTQTLGSTLASITCDRRTIAISSAAALTLASTRTIPDGVNGQVCVIVNVGSSPITLQDQATLPSSNLQLIASRVTIRPKGQISLQFNSIVGDWVQEGIPSTSTTGLQDTTATGLVVQTGPSGITAARTITGTNGITVNNGSGVSGNPTISMPGSTKGDLVVHDGTGNTRLGSGSDGQTLVADATQAAGMKWTARSIAGANGLNIANGDWATSSPATISLPGTTKGDLIAHDGSTNVRVGGGSNGQTLVADATQAAGMKWATRAIAGANGLGVTNGDWATGSPATISLPGTTKGDLIAHDGSTNVRVGGGSNGQTLVADATQAAGIKWATRSITGANGLSITNGDWASGNPTISLPGTTKGDLIAHNGSTNVRVGGGSNGQTLVADATQAAGIKWATRSITGANGLSITNGDWASGNPTISLPGTTKGDLIVHNGSTNVRVGSGSDGQTLVADATQAAGMKWATRSITGANGLSITNGDWASGNPTISLPGTTKGDLIVHNGTTNVPLAAGANGQILTADSTQAAGVKWAAPPSTSTSTSKFLLASVWSGSNRQLAAGQTSYLTAAGGLGSWAADVYLTSIPLASAYTLSKACVKTYTTQSPTGSLVLTLMSDTAGNGTFAATPITITIPAGQTQGIFCDASNAFTNNAGDQIVWRAVNSASAASTYIYSITMEAVAQ